MQTPVCRESVPVCGSVISPPTLTHTHTRAAGLSVTFNDPPQRPQSSEPACHPFSIRVSLLGLGAGHDRWRTSMVRLKLDLNRRPFGPGDKVAQSLATIYLPVMLRGASGPKAESGEACNKGVGGLLGGGECLRTHMHPCTCNAQEVQLFTAAL